MGFGEYNQLMLKLFIFAPDQQEIIEKIVDAASQAGAGIIGNYTHCSFITKGVGSWFSGEGSHPFLGKTGEFSTEPEVRIEMECPDDKASEVDKAVKKVHPYEEAVIEFLKIENK